MVEAEGRRSTGPTVEHSRDALTLLDRSERGVDLFWPTFLQRLTKLQIGLQRGKVDPRSISPRSLDRDLRTDLLNSLGSERLEVNEIMREWQRNLVPRDGCLVDVLEVKAEGQPLSAYLPASVDVANGPYATYGFFINSDFGEGGILRFGDCVVVDVIPIPLPDSRRPEYPQAASAVLEGEIARLAISPPFVFNLQGLKEISPDKSREAIASLLKFMIELGWADCGINLELSGIWRKPISGGAWNDTQEVPMKEMVKTGGRPLYAGLLRRKGEAFSGSLEDSIISGGFPFSSTQVNWPEKLERRQLCVITDRERMFFKVDAVSSAAAFHRYVSVLYSEAILKCLLKGDRCISHYIALQRVMGVSGALADLSIVCCLSAGFKISDWRTAPPAKRDLVLPSLPELSSGF